MKLKYKIALAQLPLLILIVLLSSMYINTVGYIYENSDVSETVKDFHHIEKIVILIGALLFILSLLITFWLTEKITKPLINLANLVHDIAENNFNRRIDIESRDEVGQLSQEFNDMITNLQEYQNSAQVDLVQTKRLLQSTIDNLPESILLFSIQDKAPIFVNKKALEFIGIPGLKQDGIKSETIMDYMPIEIRRRIEEIHNFFFQNPDQEVPEELLQEISYHKFADISGVVYPVAHPILKEDKSIKAFSILLLRDDETKQVEDLNFYNTLRNIIGGLIVNLDAAVMSVIVADDDENAKQLKALARENIFFMDKLYNVVFQYFISKKLQNITQDDNLADLAESYLTLYYETLKGKGVKVQNHLDVQLINNSFGCNKNLFSIAYLFVLQSLIATEEVESIRINIKIQNNHLKISGVALLPTQSRERFETGKVYHKRLYPLQFHIYNRSRSRVAKLVVARLIRMDS